MSRKTARCRGPDYPSTIHHPVPAFRQRFLRTHGVILAQWETGFCDPQTNEGLTFMLPSGPCATTFAVSSYSVGEWIVWVTLGVAVLSTIATWLCVPQIQERFRKKKDIPATSSLGAPPTSFESTVSSRKIDKRTFEDVMRYIPSDGKTIEFLRETFRWDWEFLRQDFSKLWSLAGKGSSSDHEFRDPELERLRKHLRQHIEGLRELIDEFRRATETKNASDKHLKAVYDSVDWTARLEKAAAHVCQSYDRLIEGARARLYTPLGN
jgi:hypothetical protein